MKINHPCKLSKLTRINANSIFLNRTKFKYFFLPFILYLFLCIIQHNDKWDEKKMIQNGDMNDMRKQTTQRCPFKVLIYNDELIRDSELQI